MATMIEAHVDANTNVTLHEVPVPRLTNPHQILVKVIVSGLIHIGILRANVIGADDRSRMQSEGLEDGRRPASDDRRLRQ